MSSRPASGGAPSGNKNAEKPDISLELKNRLYDSWCEHLAEGRVRDSWSFNEGDFYICNDTLESMIKKDPVVFPPARQKAARNAGLKKWEKVAEESADGKNTKGNVAALGLIMRNKFKWDKKEEVVDHEKDLAAQEQIRILMQMVRDLQQQVSYERSIPKSVSVKQDQHVEPAPKERDPEVFQSLF